jgi:hypothetical protein
MEKGARCSHAQKYYTRLEVAIVTNAQTYIALVLITTVKKLQYRPENKFDKLAKSAFNF